MDPKGCWRAALVCASEPLISCNQRPGFHLGNGQLGFAKYRDEIKTVENTFGGLDVAHQRAHKHCTKPKFGFGNQNMAKTIGVDLITTPATNK